MATKCAHCPLRRSNLFVPHSDDDTKFMQRFKVGELVIEPVMGEMQHSVEATTPMTLCVFNRAEFWHFFKTHPERAFDLTWLAAVEEHFMGETLATVGQRDATERVAWALVKIMQRGEALGLVKNHTMPLHYRQQDLADALGLSLVHTNKTLAKLRERQLASWHDGALFINDCEKLAKIARMDTEAPPQRPLM